MSDETTVLSRDAYWALGEAERMEVRVLAMRRAAEASADEMRRHGRWPGGPGGDPWADIEIAYTDLDLPHKA